MTPDELRSKYLAFFQKNSHAVIPSAPLVPQNDPTTLFTGSGMQPLVPYLLGETHPAGKRLVDSQKSFRSEDIEEVGDNRHTTFFEMLGNWSLGDYFKKEQLRWFFTFLTDKKIGLGLDPQKLYVTVFAGDEKLHIARDDDAVKIWQELFAEKNIEAKPIELISVQRGGEVGMQGGRIFYYEAKKNWWSRSGPPSNMPVGEPGGPDSEVFYEFDSIKHDERFGKHCHPNCDCGRFLEIGNSVFMEYIKKESGFEKLPQQNVDFGGGLERLTAATNDNPDVFMTEAFQPLIKVMERLSSVSYAQTAFESQEQRAFRVIADHVRAATMLACDGVLPGNKEQGYFVRRLLRRAIRHARVLKIDKPFIGELVDVVVGQYQDAYPEILGAREQVALAFQEEEFQFLKTLEKGLHEFEKWSQKNESELSALVAFNSLATYGFPFEMIVEEANNRGIALEKGIEEKFAQLRAQHAEQSRQASAGKFKGGLADHSEQTVKFHTATHLLHAALRQTLGPTVRQEGSNITSERLRFDFAYPQAMTAEQKQTVEDQINAWIQADLPVSKQMMAKDIALKAGAMAFFREKYPDQVSVYTVGKDPEKDWISKELCGGPHVARTGEIGPIKITKEQSVSAGVRRIYIEFAPEIA